MRPLPSPQASSPLPSPTRPLLCMGLPSALEPQHRGPVSQVNPSSVSQARTASGAVFIGLSVCTTTDFALFMGCVFQKGRGICCLLAARKQNTVERRDDAVVSRMRASSLSLPPFPRFVLFLKEAKFSLQSLEWFLPVCRISFAIF